jgi:hypothetical protein
LVLIMQHNLDMISLLDHQNKTGGRQHTLDFCFVLQAQSDVHQSDACSTWDGLRRLVMKWKCQGDKLPQYHSQGIDVATLVKILASVHLKAGAGRRFASGEEAKISRRAQSTKQHLASGPDTPPLSDQAALNESDFSPVQPITNSGHAYCT